MTRREKRIMNRVVRLLKKLGWNIAIHTGDEENPETLLQGFIAGNSAYVDYVLKHLD